MKDREKVKWGKGEKKKEKGSEKENEIGRIKEVGEKESGEGVNFV